MTQRVAPAPQQARRISRSARLVRQAWLGALGVLASFCAAAQDAAAVDVQAERNGELIDVRAHAVVDATLALVWGTLTDYERLPEFIPGMASSRVIARQGATVTVEQTGEARFLFLAVPIWIKLEATERPPYVLEVRRVAGSIAQLQGRYEAALLPNHKVRLRWSGSVSPQSDLPPLIGTALARLLIQQQFNGMVREIEHRAGRRRPDVDSTRGNR